MKYKGQEIEVNKNYVNKAIKANILDDDTMRVIGFTDHNEKTWYFTRSTHDNGVCISFNIVIPKDGSDITIGVLDEAFLQPYDYQYYLEKNPEFKFALRVQAFVESQMKYLKDLGVIDGWDYGMYI